MKTKIIILGMLVLFVSMVSAEFDYVIGQEYAQYNSKSMWIDGANGLILEFRGQTFTAPYTLNITGFKFKSSLVQSAGSNITTYMATVKSDHTPNVSTLVAEEPISTFSAGWNTWIFDTPYLVTEGTEYAIWWGGDILGGPATNQIQTYITNSSIVDFDGGILFKSGYGAWTYSAGDDFVINLTFYGDEPIEEVIEEEPIHEDNVAGNAIYIATIQQKSAERKLAVKCDTFLCAIQQVLLNLRQALLDLRSNLGLK